MAKRKIPRQRKPSPKALQVSEAALRQVAALHGIPVEEVRKQIQIALLNGLINGQMDVVPREGDIPTPEEVIAYGAERAMEKQDK